MNNLIKHQLHKLLLEIHTPQLRNGGSVQLSDEEIQELKNISWQQLKIDEIGDDGHSIIHLKVVFPFKTNASDGIMIDIQLVNDTLYQLHLNFGENLQNLGLGYKICRALINEFGHIYSGKGRVLNPIANKMLSKLAQDPDIDAYQNEMGELYILKNNPDKEKLLKFFN